VAGALALVLQLRNQLQPTWGAVDFRWPILSSTLRGLSIHNAREAGAFAGPDFRFGYGLFDAVATARVVGNDATATFNPSGGHPRPYVKEILLSEGAPNYIQFRMRVPSTPTGPLKATICWNDPAGSEQTFGVEQSTRRLVNDLDLRIYPPGTTTFDPTASSTFKPWILNPDLIAQTAAARGQAATTGDDLINNVEQVVVNNPTAGSDYIVRVTHKGTTLSGRQQWVSIILSGSDVIPAPNFVLSPSNQGAGNVVITWPAVPAGIYKIQGASSVIGPWTDATGEISANRETMAVLANAPSSPYFWRGIRYY